MKIFYFYQYFSTNNGKWGTRAYEFSKRWVKQGNEVTVFTCIYDKSDIKTNKLIETIYIDGIRVIVLNISISNKHNISIRILTFMIYTLFSIYYSIKNNYDIIICSSGPITIGIPGLVSKFLRNKKFIFEVRDIFSDGLEQLGIVRNKILLRFLRTFEDLLYDKCDSIVVLSESMRSWINSKNNIKSDKIFVITNATDKLENIVTHNMRIDEKFKFNGKKIVVYYGTIGVCNNCIQIIEAAKILKKRKINNVKIWIIGDGKERSTLEKLSFDHGLFDILEFHDPIPRNVLFQILQKCSCSLLILKNIEVFDTVSPNKLFDAFAVGLPIIQTTEGWIKKLVDEHQIGINVKSECQNSLADAIFKVTSNDDLRSKLSRNSKLIGKTFFDRNKLANSYLTIMTSI